MNKTPEQIIITAFQQFAGKSPADTLSEAERDLGFNLMNDTISVWNADGLFVPYFKTSRFNFIPGIGQYVFALEQPLDFDPSYQVWVKDEVPVDLYYLNYTYTTIDFPMRKVGTAQYFRQLKLTNLLNLPKIFFLEKQLNSAIIFIYPFPNIIYPAVAKFKPTIESLKKNRDVELPGQYSNLFTYEIGKRLCDFYRVSSWTQWHEDELKRLRNIIGSSNEFSCSIITDGVLSTPRFWGRSAINGSVII